MRHQILENLEEKYAKLLSGERYQRATWPYLGACLSDAGTIGAIEEAYLLGAHSDCQWAEISYPGKIPPCTVGSLDNVLEL